MLRSVWWAELHYFGASTPAIFHILSYIMTYGRTALILRWRLTARGIPVHAHCCVKLKQTDVTNLSNILKLLNNVRKGIALGHAGVLPV